MSTFLAESSTAAARAIQCFIKPLNVKNRRAPTIRTARKSKYDECGFFPKGREDAWSLGRTVAAWH
eukprot:5503655-Pleurochrysis_carterae.AAC.1